MQTLGLSLGSSGMLAEITDRDEGGCTGVGVGAVLGSC